METALAQVLWITTLIQLLRGLFVTGYPVPTKAGKKAEETNQQGCYKVQSEGYPGKEGITSHQLKERLKNRAQNPDFTRQHPLPGSISASETQQDLKTLTCHRLYK